MAKGDPATLRAVGEACAAIPGAEARASEILRAAVDADPLARGPRRALAKLLPGDEVVREGQLADALGASAAEKPAPK